ncbi:MAG: rhodanese-like domain-containing protein [Cyclobacteriaceae bacterium]|nr:rhodanese-like domain-containing protein [Cyclobacteriaceae bacterium]
MKTSIALTLLMVVFTISFSQSTKKVYVCTPCGYDCDRTEYNSPGTCSTCGMAYVEKSTVDFDNITFAEMCERVKKNKDVLLLDVRSPGEFSGENTSVSSFGHFKGAVNINVSDLPSRLSELEAYKDKEIIVYCSHSHRSPRAAYLMKTNGFKNVTNVLGGVSILEREFGENDCVSELFVNHVK